MAVPTIGRSAGPPARRCSPAAAVLIPGESGVTVVSTPDWRHGPPGERPAPGRDRPASCPELVRGGAARPAGGALPARVSPATAVGAPDPRPAAPAGRRHQVAAYLDPLGPLGLDPVPSAPDARAEPGPASRGTPRRPPSRRPSECRDPARRRLRARSSAADRLAALAAASSDGTPAVSSATGRPPRPRRRRARPRPVRPAAWSARSPGAPPGAARRVRRGRRPGQRAGARRRRRRPRRRALRRPTALTGPAGPGHAALGGGRRAPCSASRPSTTGGARHHLRTAAGCERLLARRVDEAPRLATATAGGPAARSRRRSRRRLRAWVLAVFTASGGGP
jgi:hypothetical protein